MKSKSYLLKIDKPCSEDWTSMTTNNAGKFCSHCSKNVIDFTILSDNEILKIIEKTEGKLCGRLNKSQLNKFLVKTAANPARMLYSKILAGFLLLTTANKSEAKGVPIVENVAQINNLTTTPYSNLLEQQPRLAGDSTNLIKGRVINSEHEQWPNSGLPVFSIILKGTILSALTDKEGKFQLMVPDRLLSEQLAFEVSHTNYETTSFIVYKKHLPLTKDLLITLKQEQALMGGIIAGVKIEYVKKKKWWQKKGS